MHFARGKHARLRKHLVQQVSGIFELVTTITTDVILDFHRYVCCGWNKHASDNKWFKP